MLSVAGSFLVARPSLEDGFFGRSVILMLQHGQDGAFGLVLNRVAKAKDFPFPLHVGGPCKFQGFILVHGQEDWVDATEKPAAQICPGVYLGDADCFKRILDPPPGSDWNYRVFTGYAGWGPGQLDAELAQSSWLIMPVELDLIFEIPAAAVWEMAIRRLGADPSLLQMGHGVH